MRRHFLLFLTLCSSAILHAQIARLGEDVKYEITGSGQFGTGDHTPFWQTANRYGLSSVENNTGYLRTAIGRSTEADSLRNWRIGYCADIVAPINYTSNFIVQQLYGDFQYKKILLSVGQKERQAELKNNELSSGGMTLGTNARPIPQVRLDFFPDYIVFKRTNNWLALKGHIAYGSFTDNKWQREFNAGNKMAVYNADAMYHSKAGYLRIGNTEKFPLVLTGGVEMACQFGGTVWNRWDIKNLNPDGSYNFSSGIMDIFKAFIPTGSDVTDGDNPNVAGNHLGSYLARLDYHGKGWMASVYGEHMFEDHSMMGFDFAWKDFLWGLEVKLPQNPIVSAIVMEHQRTTDQSGPILLSHGDKVHNIGGKDNYYNHGIYGAYQHAGFIMGNPLILSPIYNTDGRIYSYDNRVTAFHTGLSGTPTPELSYRILYTHEKSLGAYNVPHEFPRKGDMLLVETSYTPRQVKGLGITASYGMNHGDLLGKSHGGMLTISYSGWINKQ